MGKTSQKKKEKRLAGRVSLALAAGMFSVVPVAHGMPTFDKVDSAHGTSHDVTVKFNDTAATAGMKVPDNAIIKSNKTNTIIDWKDFSIEKNHTVNFEDNKNFMNIVTGMATSAIDGTINGTGDIYLINPNGVIFGKTASVNVGNLYVSTREAEGIKAAFLEGNPDTPSAFSSVLAAANTDTTTLAPADVVNLMDQGTGSLVAANQVVMEGRNIRFLNVATVQTGEGGLFLRSNKNSENYAKGYTDGYIHVGHRINAEAEDYTNYKAEYVNDADTVRHTDGTTDGVANYTLVYNTNPNNDPSKLLLSDIAANGIGQGYNYMLAEDIQNAGSVQLGTAAAKKNSSHDCYNPGTAFSGMFDGMFYTISGVNLSQTSDLEYKALFGYTNGARIENLGVKNANVSANYAGGIVGYADGQTTLLNVWNEGGGTIGNGGRYAGGIVGVLEGQSKLESAYNNSTVDGGAGIVGHLNGHIWDAYNTGEVSRGSGKNWGIVYSVGSSGSSIDNVYTTVGKVSSGIEGDNTVGAVYDADQISYNASNYTFKDSTGNSNIATEGGSGKTWRIYEGQSLPLLTAFFKGTVSTDYNYQTYKTDGSANGDPLNSLQQYAGADGIVGTADDGIAGKTYDAHAISPFTSPVPHYEISSTDTGNFVYKNGDYVEATDEDAALIHYARVDNVDYLGANADSAKIIANMNRFNQQDVELSGNNATSFALFASGQQGYDLYGNNFIIKKRSVAFDPNNPPDFVKTYDGDADAAPLLKNMLSGATPIAGDMDTGFIGTDSTYVNFWIDPTKVTAKFGTGTTKEAFVENGNTTWANDVNTKRNILVDGVVGGSGDYATVKLQAKTVDGDGITPEQAAKAQIVVRNYELSTESAAALNGVYTNKGTINQRKVKVELKNNTGIDKTYDGTTAVLDAYNGVSNITATSLADDDSTKDIKDSSVISALFGNEKENGKVAFGTITTAYNNPNVNLIQDPNYPNDTTKKTEGTRTVTYSGIVLTGNASNNYLLVDAQGNPLTSGTLTGSGKILRRKINASDFEIASSGSTPPPHVYDGNDHVNLDTPLAVTIAAEKQKGAGDQTIGEGETAPTGIISTDYNANLFRTSKITFRDGNGNPTADASDSGLATKATKATYDVEATDATLGNNYTWSNEAGYSGNVISRREIRVELGTKTNIDKTYDGTATVKGKDANNKSYTDFGGPYMQYAEGATYHLVKTDGVKDADDSTKAIDDKVHIEVSAVYKKQTGAPNSERNQDVAQNADGTADLDANKKDVQYSIAVVNDTGSTKNNAANYLIVAKEDNEWTAVTANDARLRATGKIDQMDLTEKITLDDAKKLYDGTKTAYVTAVDTHVKTLPAINLKQGASLGDGDSIGDVFGNQTGNDGYLSKLSNGTYADANAAGTAEIEVQYADVGNAMQGTLRGSNYKITGTVYGKGYIEKNHISATDWQAWVNPVSNAANLFKKTYNGDNGYTGTAPNVADLLPTTGHVLGISDAEWNAGSLSIAYSIATYSQKDAGEYTKNDANNYVSVAFTVSGELANYTYDNSFTGKYNGTIEKAPITVSVIHGAPSKTYDGTTAVVTNDDTLTVGDALSTVKDNNWNQWLQLSGAINETEGNNLKLQNGVTARYANKNATDNATVIYENIQLLNDEVGKNYQISNLSSDTTINKGITGTGTINKRTIRLNYGVTTKTYDGNADVTNKTFKAVSYNSDGKDLTTLKKDNIITDITGDNAGIITHADLSGFYLQTGSSASDPDGWDNNKAGNVRRKGEERTVANKDVQYSGLTSVFNSDNYVVIDADDNKVIDKDNSIAKNFVTVTNGGVINPVKFHMNDGDVFLKNTTVSRAYSGTTTIDDAKSDLNYTATTINPIASNVASGVLLVTGNFESADANTGDAKQKVTYTVNLNPEKDIINFDLDGTHRKENSNAEAEYVFDNAGKITPKVIYAHLDNEKIKESVGSNASADKIKEYLTKTYDGDAEVEKNISSWVQLDSASTTAITDIVDAGGKGVVLADGITTEYVTDAYARDKNAADAKKIAFRNIVLQAAADTADDAINNYKLVLKDGDTELVEDTPLTTTGKITKKSVNLSIAPVYIEKTYDSYATITTGDESNKAQFETALAASVTTWKTANLTEALAEDEGTFGLDTSGLTGVYGNWDPSNANNFITDPNVHREGNTATGTVKEKSHDVLYYGFKLNDASTQNYELANVTTYTVDGVSASDLGLGDTVYFKEAAQSGTIRPLAITLDRVKEKWTAPDTKVYDKNPSIASVMGSDGTYTYTAYDVNGQAITKTANDYLTIYFDKTNDGYSPDDIPITYTVDSAAYTYTVDSATYNDANAGDVKSITYSGFHFSNTELGNYTITDGSLNDSTKYGKGLTATVKGSIARRLLVVAADGTDHTKTYDGNEHSLLTYIENGEGNYVENPLAYTVAAQSLQNDNGTGRVGNDKVSVTYVANFNQTTGGNDAHAQDVNFVDPTIGTYNKKDVVYTFKLSGDDASNYTIVADERTPGDNGMTTTATQQGVSAIKPREVYVDFAKDGQGHSYGENLDKTYDGKSTPLLATGMSVNDILTLVANGNDTGIVAGEENTVHLKDGTTANYVDQRGNVSADADAKLGITTTRDVYFQNFALDGAGANNYVVKVKNGADKKSVTNPTTTAKTLIGKGKINQREIGVSLKENTVISKTYDTTANVMDVNGQDYNTRKKFATGDERRYLNADDHIQVKAADAVSDGLAAGETIATAQIEVESALYYDGNNYVTSDAASGLGVTYTLKVDNKNYKLVQVPLTTLGEIKKKTLTVSGDAVITKTYDGNAKVTDASGLAKDLFGVADTDPNKDGVYQKDLAGLLTIDTDASYYDRSNVYANAEEAAAHKVAKDWHGTEQGITVVYALNGEGKGKNYEIANDPTSGIYDDVTGKWTYNGGTGRIDRAKVTMTPTEVSYYSSKVSTATYTGKSSGFVNGDKQPTMTYGRDENTSTTAGSYTLLGYVDGARVPVNGGLFADGFENYYFTTTPNTSLHIVADPVNPDPVDPDVPGFGKKTLTQAITENVIGDKRFTPDDYSYNRISKDQDTTRVKRASSATLQYSEKGVNLEGDDTKSGLAALADIQGAGSVVNLEGALIRTSAPTEQPETVAAEAALPLPETEESDISSISLEYAGDGDNSQALLEILTNASSNAEKKGTSIVIDAQDEDEEDAEEEKSRRAIFADRSNIGIETLGDAVNLNQMIG